MNCRMDGVEYIYHYVIEVIPLVRSKVSIFLCYGVWIWQNKAMILRTPRVLATQLHLRLPNKKGIINKQMFFGYHLQVNLLW